MKGIQENTYEYYYEKKIKEGKIENIVEQEYNINVNDINNLKNQSLYVSIKDDKFVSPDIVITKDMVKDIGLWTLIRLKGM